MVLAALDLWTLFVDYVFGGFFLAVIGIALLIFVIMAILGRVSIFSTMWYVIMFILAMSLGYGIIIVNMAISLILIVMLIFAWSKWVDSK